MSEQSKGGVFVPYPLLAILTPALLLIMGALVSLIVMVNSMQTTMLLRDADHKAESHKQWQKIEQLEVYLHDDREKLIKIEERDRERERRRQ